MMPFTSFTGILHPALWNGRARFDPLATLETANVTRRRGYGEEAIARIFSENPKEFLCQCPKFSAA